MQFVANLPKWREAMPIIEVVPVDCRVQSVFIPLEQTTQVNSDDGHHWSTEKLAYYGRNFLIG